MLKCNTVRSKNAGKIAGPAPGYRDVTGRSVGRPSGRCEGRAADWASQGHRAGPAWATGCRCGVVNGPAQG